MANSAESMSGIIRVASAHSVGESIDRLEALLKQRVVLIFARIDFSADAQRAGLAMPPEQLLIFGNPKAGTPLMLAAPIAGLDLPIKVLCWQAAEAQVWMAYNAPAYVLQRHGLADSYSANLAAVVPLIERAADSVALPS